MLSRGDLTHLVREGEPGPRRGRHLPRVPQWDTAELGLHRIPGPYPHPVPFPEAPLLYGLMAMSHTEKGSSKNMEAEREGGSRAKGLPGHVWARSVGPQSIWVDPLVSPAQGLCSQFSRLRAHPQFTPWTLWKACSLTPETPCKESGGEASRTHGGYEGKACSVSLMLIK